MNINIINVDSSILKDLVSNSALTIEGLAIDSIKDFINWIEKYTPLKRKNVYVTKGRLANDEWHLTGRNAYINDLTIVSIKLDDMEDYKKIIIPRLYIGARWMDDIYNNNVRCERAY